jgi:Zn-dependent peptidase ImmA (M78 family)/DNA-binding XRE family transcriptional regulator
LGLTQAAIAAELGVHRPTISEIEAGRRAVTAEELYRLSALYGASVAEILADAPAEAVEAAEFLALRSDEADSPSARLALKRFVADRKAEFELEELLGLAHPASAAIRREAPQPRNTMDAVEQGESLATLERRQFGLGADPAGSILHLLARQGVRIGPLRALPTDRIDGVYFESADLGPCVGVNWRDGDWTGGRAAFTAAHEYSHVILRDRAREVFHLAAGTRDLQEVRANAFAAAFLMPAEGLRGYFAGKGLLRGQALTHLAPADVVRAMDYFGVSRSALLFRLQSLGLISQELTASLNDFTVSSVARAAGVMFREREYIGTRLPELAIHAWRLGHITAGRAAELCDLDLQAFRELMRELGEEQELDEDAPLVGASAAR